MPKYATIAATARFLPEIEVSNDGLRAQLQHVPEFVDKMEAGTGIRKRWYAPANWATSDVALPAARLALQRAGIQWQDLGLIEIHEAFASQVLSNLKGFREELHWEIDEEKINVMGGSIAIGHPFGMTGSRMVGTIANEMLRRKARYGVVTMCIGGGQGAAGLFEACN